MSIRLILAETSRSYYYLKKLTNEKINISSIIYYSKHRNKTYSLIKKKNLLAKTELITADNINDQRILKCINRNNFHYTYTYHRNVFTITEETQKHFYNKQNKKQYLNIYPSYHFIYNYTSNEVSPYITLW